MWRGVGGCSELRPWTSRPMELSYNCAFISLLLTRLNRLTTPNALSHLKNHQWQPWANRGDHLFRPNLPLPQNTHDTVSHNVPIVNLSPQIATEHSSPITHWSHNTWSARRWCRNRQPPTPAIPLQRKLHNHTTRSNSARYPRVARESW